MGSRRTISMVCLALACVSCTPPPATLVEACKPIPASKLRDVYAVTIQGSAPDLLPGDLKITVDPRFVRPLLAALEHGIVDDPYKEARARMDSPAHQKITLRMGGPGFDQLRGTREVFYDGADLDTSRYRKEFVDALVAAYRGGEDFEKYELRWAKTASHVGMGLATRG